MNEINFTPIYNRVLIIKNENKNETSGGIALLNDKYTDVFNGKIVAIGKGALSNKGEIKKMEVKIGDVVYFNKSVGVHISLSDIDYILMNDDDILAVET